MFTKRGRSLNDPAKPKVDLILQQGACGHVGGAASKEAGEPSSSAEPCHSSNL